ncbi:MAG: YerC/YecD family TrpR-related protein [Patescibacteria group bacterium]
MPQWDTKITQNLFRAVLKLKNEQEAKRFFRDLLTEAELVEFGKRWQAAQMLNNRVPYSEIVEKTGLSSTTVARISKWLKRGMGGYRLMLTRLSHHTTPSFGKRLS